MLQLRALVTLRICIHTSRLKYSFFASKQTIRLFGLGKLDQLKLWEEEEEKPFFHCSFLKGLSTALHNNNIQPRAQIKKVKHTQENKERRERNPLSWVHSEIEFSLFLVNKLRNFDFSIRKLFKMMHQFKKNH